MTKLIGHVHAKVFELALSLLFYLIDFGSVPTVL